jgi:hypothetical protein
MLLLALSDVGVFSGSGGAVVFNFYCQKIFNSFWFIGLLVFAAVLLTSVSFSAPAERDLSVKEQSMIQSHWMAVPYTGKPPRRSTRKQ